MTNEHTMATDDMQQATAPTTDDRTQQDEAERGFAALGLGEQALRAINDLGYSTPTPIQEQTIKLLLAGSDVIAQAPTGTGKTAAYGLPIVDRLDERDLRPQALIVTPTRELAMQVAEVLHALGKYREMVTLPIYGGQPYDRQLRALRRGVQVVVGTPGRLLDHLNRGTLDLSAIRTVVLDEADEMLDMGFIEDIETILAALPKERQSSLFSATIPPRIARLAEQYLHDPQLVRIAEREATAPRVRQVYYEVPGPAKPEALSRILDLEQPDSVIVFVRTRRDADVLSEQLSGQGYLAQAIHGEVTQSQRERVLERFREGRTQILVATDVAARGLDIPDVSHVINYDLPFDAESYVHRIGRTGRAGKTGEALTLVTPRERRQFMNIEHAIHRRLERLRLPTPADVAARRRAAFREEILKVLDDGELDPYLALVEDLAGTRNPTEIAAAAFKLATQARESSRGASAPTVRRPSATGAPAMLAPRGAPPFTPATPAERELSPSDHGVRAEPPAPRRRPLAQEPASAEGEEPGDRRFPEHPRERPVAPGSERRRPRERFDRVPMARLLLRVGKSDGVRPADIVGAIANEAGLPGDSIGDIDLYDAFSLVEVPEDAVEQVRTALNKTNIRGVRPSATLARPTWQWEPQDEDRPGARRTPRKPAPGRPFRGGDDDARSAPQGRRGRVRAPESKFAAGPRKSAPRKGK